MSREHSHMAATGKWKPHTYGWPGVMSHPLKPLKIKLGDPANPESRLGHLSFSFLFSILLRVTADSRRCLRGVADTCALAVRSWRTQDSTNRRETQCRTPPRSSNFSSCSRTSTWRWSPPSCRRTKDTSKELSSASSPCPRTMGTQQATARQLEKRGARKVGTRQARQVCGMTRLCGVSANARTKSSQEGCRRSLTQKSREAATDTQREEYGGTRRRACLPQISSPAA